MLEYNRIVKKRLAKLWRIALLIVPMICIVVLLSQTVFARSTYVISDGGRVLLHTTYATDPAKILNEAGLTLGEQDIITTQRAFPRSASSAASRSLCGGAMRPTSLPATARASVRC